MNENKDKNIQSEENLEAEVVFNEAYDAKEVESTVITEEEEVLGQEDFEDEDELDRIPLENEPTMQEVLTEVSNTANDSKSHQMNSTGIPGRENGQSSGSEKKEYGLGVTAMILGILSILLFCIPFFGIVLGAVSIVLGIVASAKNNGKKNGTFRYHYGYNYPVGIFGCFPVFRWYF